MATECAIGYNFFCQNPDCLGFDKMLSLGVSWPLVKIDYLLALEDVQKDTELLQGLQMRKKEGREFACAILPNKHNLPYCGARAQLFCPKDKILWDEDFLGVDWRQALPTHEAKCHKCHGDLIDAETAKDQGLPCPLCGVIMKPQFWFKQDRISNGKQTQSAK